MRAPSHLRRGATRLLAAATVATVIGLGSVPAGADPLPIDVPVPTVPVPALPGPTDGGKAEAARPSAAPQPLVGTFGLAAGACTSSVTGSYFRMIQPGGTGRGLRPERRLAVHRHDLHTDGARHRRRPGDRHLPGRARPGLRRDRRRPRRPHHQAAEVLRRRLRVGHQPDRSADGHRGRGADASPTTAPASCTGDLRAFGASWNNQNFNQGAPKPDGSTPGIDHDSRPARSTRPPVRSCSSGRARSWADRSTASPACGTSRARSPRRSRRRPRRTTPAASAAVDSSTSGTPATSSGSAAPTGSGAGSRRRRIGLDRHRCRADPLALTGPTFSSAPVWSCSPPAWPA